MSEDAPRPWWNHADAFRAESHRYWRSEMIGNAAQHTEAEAERYIDKWVETWRCRICEYWCSDDGEFGRCTILERATRRNDRCEEFFAVEKRDD